uniref:Uncharacterized protein n=1 Tax=Timema monikensis TaxID=170555 RepID=A0A7R9EL04_9NEOP|nr:unnamed protein product [Timema monikensis]
MNSVKEVLMSDPYVKSIESSILHSIISQSKESAKLPEVDDFDIIKPISRGAFGGLKTPGDSSILAVQTIRYPWRLFITGSPDNQIPLATLQYWQSRQSDTPGDSPILAVQTIRS